MVFQKKTIQRFEKFEEVTGTIVTILDILSRQINLVSNYSIPNMTEDYPIRLYYKKDILCTTIDINEIHQKIKIKNYTFEYTDCAFGNNKQPQYVDYVDFLKSRCFPEQRDKMRLLLKVLIFHFMIRL